MANFGKWHVGGIVVAGVIFVAAVLFAKESTKPAVYGVCTVGYNYSEKPIYWFGVTTPEGSCGNNVGGKRSDEVYSGGGGVACGCSVRPGGTAVVKWELDEPYADVQRGVPTEKHQISVVIPQPESRAARYLQVHFLADHRVVLDWRNDISFSRIDPTTGKVLKLDGGWINPETGEVTHGK